MLKTLTSTKESEGLMYKLTTTGVGVPERHLFLMSSPVKLSDSLTGGNL